MSSWLDKPRWSDGWPEEGQGSNRVKIVETRPHGFDVLLRLDNGDTMTVGGDLRTNVRELQRAVARSLDVELTLPKRVSSGDEPLAVYLLGLSSKKRGKGKRP